jgi:hypothetical protein
VDQARELTVAGFSAVAPCLRQRNIYDFRPQ